MQLEQHLFSFHLHSFSRQSLSESTSARLSEFFVLIFGQKIDKHFCTSFLLHSLFSKDAQLRFSIDRNLEPPGFWNS